jgi:hypothetical protein
MKLITRGDRVLLDCTRVEALLIKDAIHDFADYRKETESWDSQVDGLITANMNKKLEGVA